MKRWKSIGVLILCLALAGSIACSPFGGDKDEASQQLAEVVRGDLAVSVSGSGNIEILNEAKLAFDIGGRMVEIKVEEGDRITKGQQIARLDDTDYQLAVELAEVDLKAVQENLKTARIDIEIADYTLRQSEITYRATWAEGGLVIESSDLTDTIYTDLPAVRFALEEADHYLARAQELITEGNFDEAQAQLELVQEKLVLAEEKAEGKRAQIPLGVKINVLQLEKAKAALGAVNPQIDKAEIALEKAKKDADKVVLTTPFDGIVASVDAEEGDIIPSPAMTAKTIIHLIDPLSMGLKVEVDEIDIAEVKPGHRAIIEIDALPALQLEGEVTSISPLAKKEGGVVLYEVKISFDAPEGSGIRAGMSADADIVINERNNVLLVPNHAIKQDSQGNPVAKVMVGKEVQERPVVVGISDGFNTEIIDGLNEGEIVVVER